MLFILHTSDLYGLYDRGLRKWWTLVSQSITACYLSIRELAHFVKRSVVCCWNTNHNTDKIIMTLMSDVFMFKTLSCYKWITLSCQSLIRQIHLFIAPADRQGWRLIVISLQSHRDTDLARACRDHCQPSPSLLSPWFNFLSCPLPNQTGTWQKPC